VNWRYAQFLALALGLVVALCVVGWVPTRRLAGPQAGAAMVAGSAIVLLSAAVVGWLLTTVPADTPHARMQRGLLAMVVRLAIVIVLGVAAALSGEFARSPLLFWLATAYVVLLPLEVRLATL
jgi:hypothetical protein